MNPEEYNAENIGIPYITGASNFVDGTLLINRWTNKPQSVALKNDILITCKGTVGELAISDNKEVHIARQIMAMRLNSMMSIRYMKLFFMAIINDLKKTANGIIPGISRPDILSLVIPLPSLKEQTRIVKAIEQIFEVIDRIRVSLE